MSGSAECANPLLLEWVKEWLDENLERNTKGVTTYRNAYNSLKACPITFQHPQQLQQLKGFGPKICDRLTERMQRYCTQNGLPMPKKTRAGTQGVNAALGVLDEEAAELEEARVAKKRKKAPKPYVPAYRSGGYALILGLSTLDEDVRLGLTKEQLIAVSEEHCDASFRVPKDAHSFYTAWNSIRTLIDKELVFEKGRPKRYNLSDEGWEVAWRIRRANGEPDLSISNGSNTDALPPELRERSGPNSRNDSLVVDLDAPEPPQSTSMVYRDVVPVAPSTSSSAALPAFNPIRLPPGSFSIQLLLDVREVRTKTDRDYMQEELVKQGVKPVMRSLELGDVQWVAKCHDPAALGREGCDEVVLDWIAERKRLDDLVASIKDGRFHEQKFRLRRSGIRHVVYILEEISIDASQWQKHETAIQSAMAATQVVDGYFLKRTQKMDDTIKYLVRLTATLRRMYEGRTLHVVPTYVLTAQNYLPLLKSLREREPHSEHCVTYAAFASLASKSETMTLRDVFLKMLMTTRGVTGEKAIEIQKCWRTPNEFVRALEACGAGEAGRKRKREMVAGRLNHLVGRKKLPRSVTDRVAEIWGGA